MPNRVIFWKELKCWRKKLLKQGYVAPRLKSSLQKFYGRLHNLVDLRNIHISNDNGSFTFYVDVFFLLSLPRLLPNLTVHIWVTRRVSYKKQVMPTLRDHLSSPPVYLGFRVADLFSLLCCSIMCLYIRYLCMFAYSDVQHILCCVFLRFVYLMLPVSLDCPFVIAPFSSIYL